MKSLELKERKKDMKKIKGQIIYAELNQFTDNNTGVVKEMTKVLYTVNVENSATHVGSGLLECYLSGDFIKKLEEYTKTIVINGKEVRPIYDIELEERFIKNGSKLYISKINDNLIK